MTRTTTRASAAALTRLAPTLLLSALAAATLLATAGAVPRAAFAHAGYDRSSPADGAVIPRPPERLDAWFTQEIFRRGGANALEVRDEAGRRVDEDDLVLDDADRSHLSVGLPAELPPGRYTVEWRTLSAVDGDTAEGSFAFTIDPAAPEPAPSPATGEPAGGSAAGAGGSPTVEEAAGGSITTGGGGIGWWALGAAAALTASLALGARALLAPAAAPPPGRAREMRP
jgi:methionine-rich copper-binding protein CopC